VLLPDDLIDADVSVTKQLVDVARANNGSVLAVQDVERKDTSKYGIVDTHEATGATAEVFGMVEKPAPAEAPSTLAVVGRYVLEGEIFDHLRKIGKGAGGEIQLTDGIAALMNAQRKVFAHRYEGKRYDCGNKAGLFEATVALGRKYHGFE
jgi:UTP--glucose-1-phosphate uridylyltransferase